MKHKVFIVIDSLGPGGAQRQIVEYLKFADRTSFDIKVINLDKPYNTLADEIQKLGYEIIGLDHKGLLNLNTIKTLVKLFKKEKPDIVHTYLFTADVYGRIAARLVKVPVIISSIRAVDEWKRSYHILADRILQNFTRIITINAEAIRPFLIQKGKIDPQKIYKIYNGIDLNRFKNLKDKIVIRRDLGIPVNATVIGTVARFRPQKDYETIFESLQKVLEAYNDVYFVAVGDGPKEKSMSDYAKKIGIEKDVVFTGLRRDVPDLINAMDICILSSHYEGCPNVVLEYMACGKPVVATKVGGCPELIVEGETGFLVPVKDADSLAERIQVLINDSNLRTKMGQVGKKRVEENFSSQKMAENTEKLYKELLEKK